MHPLWGIIWDITSLQAIIDVDLKQWKVLVRWYLETRNMGFLVVETLNDQSLVPKIVRAKSA